MDKAVNRTRPLDVDLKRLVSALPEVYQPIYKHPELSGTASRSCEDRLNCLIEIHEAMQNCLGRAVRVLDLGCAQGFFSLHLADLGANVHGIDCLDKNIDVCRALAGERGDVVFETVKIEDYIPRLSGNQYDLVLGLSVFHHLIHERGFEYVQPLIDKLAETIPVGVFEIALGCEPVYWGPSQPGDSSHVLMSYAFVHELCRHATHLSSIERPLYFASNHYWYLDRQLEAFDACADDPHAFAKGTHLGTRRYYFGASKIAKFFRKDVSSREVINDREFRNEVDFLLNPPAEFGAPKLFCYGENDNEMWLVRQSFDGGLLSDFVLDGRSYDYEKIFENVLSQLVILEKHGLYHNDVRCWNVLVTPDEEYKLIDYGAISSTDKDCVWPHDLFMSLITFMREVTSRQIYNPTPVRKVSFDFLALPEIYRSAFVKFFAVADKERSFARLYEFIYNDDSGIDERCRTLSASFFALLSALEYSGNSQADTLLSHFENQQELSRQLEARALAAEARGQELEHRARVAEEHSREQQQLVSAAEGRCLELEQRAVAAEARSEEERRHAAATEAALTKTREERASALIRLEALTQESQRWADFAAQQLKEIAALQDKLSQQMMHGQALQDELDAAHAKVAELNQSSHHWWTVAEGRAKEIDSLQQQLMHQEVHVNWLQNDLISSRHKVDQVNRDLCESKLYADKFYKELQEVYSSKSWRVTLPMRKLFALNRRVRPMISSRLIWPFRIFRQALKGPLVALAVFVEERPSLKERTKRFVGRFPALKLRLKRFAVNNHVIQSFPMTANPAPSQPFSRTASSVQNHADTHSSATAKSQAAVNIDDLFPAEAVSRVAAMIHERGGQ